MRAPEHADRMERRSIGYTTAAIALSVLSAHALLTSLAVLAWLARWPQTIDVTPLQVLQSVAALLLAAGCLLVAAMAHGERRGFALLAAIIAPAAAIPQSILPHARLGATGPTLALAVVVQTGVAIALTGLSLAAVALLLHGHRSVRRDALAYGLVLLGVAVPHIAEGAWAAIGRTGRGLPASGPDGVLLVAALAVAVGYAHLARVASATAAPAAG